MQTQSEEKKDSLPPLNRQQSYNFKKNESVNFTGLPLIPPSAKKIEKKELESLPETKVVPVAEDDLKMIYSHGQTTLLSDKIISLSTLSNELAIDKSYLFSVEHLSDYIPNLKFYPNLIKRTKIGPVTTVLENFTEPGMKYTSFTDNDQYIQFDIIRSTMNEKKGLHFIRGGPRAEICWSPSEVNAAIVSCGGLCPGINDCIAELVRVLTWNYGVDNVFGIRWGYRGFYQDDCLPYLKLTPKSIEGINNKGGSFLGSTRGGNDEKLCKIIVDNCVKRRINQIYVIGGDGSHRGALCIYNEVKARKLKMTVIGLPKTVDNDIGVIDHSFGFDTAVEEAEKAIISARTEAQCTLNGIGIIKLMGRNAGFIARNACLAARDVDLCLIPEVDFDLEGENGIFKHIENCLKKQGYAVIVVAEGAGQHVLTETGQKDASGNQKLPPVGIWLQDQIKSHFKKLQMSISVKYNDPSYMIRSVPACTKDSIYCMIMAQNAVHAAMAGFNGCSSGLVNNRSVLIPFDLINESSPVKIDPKGKMWGRVLATTMQPSYVK